jgi:hypothetical protein
MAIVTFSSHPGESLVALINHIHFTVFGKARKGSRITARRTANLQDTVSLFDAQQLKHVFRFQEQTPGIEQNRLGKQF